MMTDEYEQQEYVTTEKLQNKNIEPQRVSDENRNLQLGKIPTKALFFYFHRVDRVKKYKQVATEYGGFITQMFGDLDLEIINLQFVMSGSAEGFVREINATQRKINDNRYSEIKLGRFGRMRREK